MPVFEGFRHKCYFHFEYFLKNILGQLKKILWIFWNQKSYFLQNFAPSNIAKETKNSINWCLLTNIFVLHKNMHINIKYAFYAIKGKICKKICIAYFWHFLIIDLQKTPRKKTVLSRNLYALRRTNILQIVQNINSNLIHEYCLFNNERNTWKNISSFKFVIYFLFLGVFIL